MSTPIAVIASLLLLSGCTTQNQFDSFLHQQEQAEDRDIAKELKFERTHGKAARDIELLKEQIRLLEVADKQGDTGQVLQAMCRIGELEENIVQTYGYK